MAIKAGTKFTTKSKNRPTTPKMRQNLLLLLLQLVNHANGEVDLFRSDCGQCGNNAVCEDILVKTQRDIRQLDHPHVKEVMSVINAMEQRYFCVTQASKLTLKFELPPPSATLMTIPTLFALNGQADIAINLMSIIEQGLAFPEFVEYQTITTRLNEFIIHLGEHRERRLLQFLREYMLVAEIAYIEQIAPIMSILPSVLSAATQEADLTEIQEAALAKENDSRIWQMLLFVGLRTEDEPENDDEEHTDRVMQIKEYFNDSNMQLDEELDQIGNPHSDPSKWEIANSLNTEPIRHFSPALLFLLSSMSERDITLKELLFILQSAPELKDDKLIPYLWTNDSSEDQTKLRTYLMARFLMPELFKYGPSVSVAIALLST